VSKWRQTRAIALLPGNVTVVVPTILLVIDGLSLGWDVGGIGTMLAVLVGVGLIVCGFLLWLWTVRLFSRIGKGTLAPWDPTGKLVVAGPYRYVRNPMITAVLTVLVGESILFGSALILAWAALFLALNVIFFPLVEEPALESRFGEEYFDYKRNVRRWLPRCKPWSQSR
jgi:protein-S-isoprenylcysteine O-methyltransferase Ste14